MASRPWRGDWAGIAGLLAAMALLATTYAWLTPPFEGPDAMAHFRYGVYLRDHAGLPALEPARVRAAGTHELAQQPPLYYALQSLILASLPLSATLAAAEPNPHYPGLSHRATVSPPGLGRRALWPARLGELLSLLGGMLAALATWLLLRELLPGRRALALAAAAVVALNPQFLFASASITNDTWAAATVALAVWLAVAAARRDWPLAGWLLVGLTLGLAALAKYSGLGAALPVGLVWLWWARDRGWRRALPAGLALALGAAAVAGWWYGALLLRYGALVPLAEIRAALPELARQPPASWSHVLGEASWLPRSYVGVFGYGVLAPEAYFRVVEALVLLALVGLAALPWRLRRRPDRTALLAAAGLALVWLAVNLVGLLGWMRLVRLANQGRLLFPAAPAIALLLVLGWWALAPARWRPALLRGVPLAAAFLALWQVATLSTAYAVPQPLRLPIATDRPLDARLEEGIGVLGVDLPAGGAVASGGQLSLTAYFQALAPVRGNYLLYVQLSGPRDERLAGFDGVPAGGRHPTRQWLTGAAFADRYRLPVAAVATDTLGSLHLGFYDPASGRRLALLDADGRPVGERVTVGHVMVRARPAAAAPDPPASLEWANGVTAGDIVVSRSASGAPERVDLSWRARAPLHRDLTVFAQLLDAQGRLLAQVDRRPRDGAAPTDTWTPGYAVADSYAFERPAPGWDRLILGLYDSRTGERVPLRGEPVADHAVLARHDRRAGR